MKKFLLLAGALLMLSQPVFAADLEQRVAELEERIAVLEELLGVSTENQAEVTEAAEQPTAEVVNLGIGTWIVGEDIAPGKYNLTCPDYAVIKIYNSYEDRKFKEYDYVEDYMMADEDYIKESFSYLDENMVDTYLKLYSFNVSNVMLDDGMCIYIEYGSINFTPVG